MDRTERQVREAFIDGYLSAADRYSNLQEATLRQLAEMAWSKENVTDKQGGWFMGQPTP